MIFKGIVDKTIEIAKNMLSNGEYDKALTEAGNALEYSSDDKYLSEFNKIKTINEGETNIVLYLDGNQVMKMWFG